MNPEGPTITILPAIPAPSSIDEVNHRIANSLQLLSVMVSVTARDIADPDARAALASTQRQIGAIARVHRQLCLSHEAAAADLAAYLKALGQDLELSFGNAAAGPRVLVHAENVRVSPEAATSIGIIVSEIVINACKYAYAPGVRGDVRITLLTIPGGYSLEIEDRGGGMASTAPGSGLGGRLVALMSARLGASHGWEDARPGTRFVLRVYSPATTL